MESSVNSTSNVQGETLAGNTLFMHFGLPKCILWQYFIVDLLVSITLVTFS